MILQAGSLIAQGLTTYTSSGGSSDLELTPPVDIPAKKTKSEKAPDPRRPPPAQRRLPADQARGPGLPDNDRKAPVPVEVSRVVLGEVADPVKGCCLEKLNLMEDREGVGGQPHDDSWYTSCGGTRSTR